MSWIAEYDTQGMEFPTCVHVTKTTGAMTHGATYVPIEDGRRVRAENAKLREEIEAAKHDLQVFSMSSVQLDADNAKLRKLAQMMWRHERFGCYGCRRECDAESCYASDCKEAVEIEQEMRDLGIEVPR